MPTADYYYVLPLIEGAFTGGAKVDARTNKVLFSGHIQPPVPGAGSKQQRPSVVLVSGFSSDYFAVALYPDGRSPWDALSNCSGVGGTAVHPHIRAARNTSAADFRTIWVVLFSQKAFGELETET